MAADGEGMLPAGVRGVGGCAGYLPSGGCGEEDRHRCRRAARRMLPEPGGTGGCGWHRGLQSSGWCPAAPVPAVPAEMPGVRGEGMEDPLRPLGSRESGSRCLSPGCSALPLDIAVSSLVLRPLGTAQSRSGADAAG